MDLTKILEFHTFAQTLSFTQAAHDMHMSVSALSKHIQSLEDELKVPLVKRDFESGHNMLTIAGRRFLDRTKPWLDEYDGIVKECQDLSEPAPLIRIHGTNNSIINIISQLRRALEPYGITAGNFTCADTKVPSREALDRDLADFACYYESDEAVSWLAEGNLSKEYGYIPLTPERPCFIASVSNPLSSRSAITLADASRFRIIVMDDALFNNWLEANTVVSERCGHRLTIQVVHDSPLSGGAFPVGPRDLVLSTNRFAKYYHDLDVEDVVTLEIKGYDSVIYPFLIYRKDTKSEGARQIIDALTNKQSRR